MKIINEFEITIQPSDNIFHELSMVDTVPICLIFEFIDNAIAAMVDNTVDVNVEIKGWENGYLDREDTSLTVTDNASGISDDSLSLALSPAGTSIGDNPTESLNEHGLGLKHAISALSGMKNFEIITKTQNCQYASFINRIGWGPQKVSHIESSMSHGTVIRINKLRPKLYERKEDYTSLFVTKLGFRYRKFLQGTVSGKKLNLQLNLINKDGSIYNSYKISPVENHYSNKWPSTVKKLGNASWKANLKMGLLADPDEIGVDSLKEGKIRRASSHPCYHMGQKVSVTFQNITIAQMDIGEFSRSHKPWASRYPFGVEIEILKGFKTTSTKDGLQKDDSWQELIRSVKKELSDHFHDLVYGQSIEIVQWEAKAKEKIVNTYEGVAGKTVEKEHVIEGLGVRIDLLVDRIVHEIKAEQVQPMDVWQAVLYVKFSQENINKKHACIVGPSISNNAKNFIKLIEEKEQISVKFLPFSTFNIIVPDTNNEEL